MKITLSPIKNCALMILITSLFMGIIHRYGYPLLKYVNQRISIDDQLIFVGVILFFISLGSTFFKKYKTDKSENENAFWRYLTINLSFNGILKSFILLIKIFLFALSLYYSAYFLIVASIGFYNGEPLFVGRGAGTFILAPIFLILMVVLYVGSIILEKRNKSNKTKTR